MAGDNTVIRAVTLPVAGPVGRSWEELNAVLKDCFRLSTHAANWCVQRLYQRDTVGQAQTPGAVRMGKASAGRFYAYGEAAREPWFAEWVGAKQGLNIVLQYAHREYLRRRFDVMVRGVQSLLTVRHPYPFPVDADGVRLSYADGGFPVAALQLPGLGSVPLRLNRRADFGRQLAMFKQLHDGTAKMGEATLYRDRKGCLLVKLVGHFPRRDRGPADNVCYLHTDPNALLVAEVNGRSVTVTNADHLRRAHAVIRETAARHRAFLDRADDDKKREVRMDRRLRSQLNDAVEARCAKQRARIGTAVKQIAAQVARFCERQRVGLVAYDDSIRTFLPDGFAWHSLKERMRQLFVGEMGGEWVDGEFVSLNAEDRGEWLERARATATAGRRAVAHKQRKGSHPKVSTSRAPRSRPASAR